LKDEITIKNKTHIKQPYYIGTVSDCSQSIILETAHLVNPWFRRLAIIALHI